jgi:PAS domain-containing protein
MGKDDRRKTKIVDEVQIVGQRPVTAELGAKAELQPKARPPVRELARTGLFQPLTPVMPPQLPPDEAPPTADATRVVRDLGEPDHLLFVERCPTPLFQLDAEARIEWVNEPFAEFARKDAPDLAGERIDSTRLGVIYPSVYSDIVTCLAEDQPPTLRQTLRYQLQDGREQARGCWIVPELDDTGRVARLFGYLLPIED